MSVSYLLREGFTAVGSWRTVHCRPHKVQSLRHAPGLYAFALGGDVMYVGMSKGLQRRLRRYSIRAFGQGSSPLRGVHTNIARSISEGGHVDIFAKVISGADAAHLLSSEAALIRILQPAWNATHRTPDTGDGVAGGAAEVAREQRARADEVGVHEHGGPQAWEWRAAQRQ